VKLIFILASDTQDAQVNGSDWRACDGGSGAMKASFIATLERIPLAGGSFQSHKL
jgi:hypothetical protein